MDAEEERELVAGDAADEEKEVRGAYIGVCARCAGAVSAPAFPGALERPWG